MSALKAALDHDGVCIHERDGSVLRLAGGVGLPEKLARAWETLPVGIAGGQIGRSLSTGAEVLSADVRTAPGWARFRSDARAGGVRSSWSVPFSGAGSTGVITVVSAGTGTPTRDEIGLVNLYAGYAVSALERDRLLGELTARNRVLETIREVLETLAGPVPLGQGLEVALRSLRAGLGAAEVGLVTRTGLGTGGPIVIRGWTDRSPTGDDLPDGVEEALDGARPSLRRYDAPQGSGWTLSTGFAAPGGSAALVLRWSGEEEPAEYRSLVDDAVHSLRLALEREASEQAQREAMALRSSQELQRKFLSWLSHELRTPLTAIRGYASSLMQPDVSWDGTSQQRFLERISEESARLGRLVDDLLDFSAIDAGILRIHPDWCDLGLVLEAARACLPDPVAHQVELMVPDELPTVWADHDRLEQLLVNLLDNAVRHNPPDTSVTVEAVPIDAGTVRISVRDDGTGVPSDMGHGPFARRAQRRSRTGGAGLGLSIVQGIVDAHGGSFEIERLETGTRCVVTLPIALGAPADG